MAEFAVRRLVRDFRCIGCLAHALWRETHRAIVLPIETFGFQFPLGGYHAVLSGFLLQFLALTIMVALQQSSQRDRSWLEFVLGLTVPLTLCASAWMLPLQAALVGAWTIWQRRVSGHWSLRYLSIGAAAGVFFLLPFLEGFSAATGHMNRVGPQMRRTHLPPNS